ncbi:hypothetical protein ACFL1H_01860 [Nanoarchaeota archaeon]
MELLEGDSNVNDLLEDYFEKFKEYAKDNILVNSSLYLKENIDDYIKFVKNNLNTYHDRLMSRVNNNETNNVHFEQLIKHYISCSEEYCLATLHQ